MDIQYSEKEMRIVEECKKDQFEDLETLRSILIGQWDFYGYVCFGTLWCEGDLYQPQPSTTVFREDGSGYHYSHKTKTSSSHGHEFEWMLVVKKLDSLTSVFSIEGNGGNFGRINIFCSEYMINESDSDIQIYRKD